MTRSSSFFLTASTTAEIYTLSLHDALPISVAVLAAAGLPLLALAPQAMLGDLRQHLVGEREQDRKSTRLNSSHQIISYAVFCLKKKTRTCPRRSRALRRSAGPVIARATSSP